MCSDYFFSIRRQPGAYVTFNDPFWKKIVSQTSFAIIFRQQLASYLWLSTAFIEVQPSPAGGSCFSTMDYCTVKLAPTAVKLTVFF